MSKYSANHAAIRALAERIPVNEGNISKTTRELVSRIEAAAGALAELNDHPDKMLSQLAINISIERSRVELKKLVADAQTRIEAMLQTARYNLEVNRAQQANLQPGPYGEEIRSIVRGLTVGERLIFLSDAVERIDGPTIAALVLPPPFLSGLTAEQSTQFRTMYLEKAVPLDSSYLDLTESAVSSIVQAVEGVLA